jgi:hypothetical protein
MVYSLEKRVRVVCLFKFHRYVGTNQRSVVNPPTWHMLNHQCACQNVRRILNETDPQTCPIVLRDDSTYNFYFLINRDLIVPMKNRAIDSFPNTSYIFVTDSHYVTCYKKNRETDTIIRRKHVS